MRLEVNGVGWNVEVVGRPVHPPLLLLHGFTGTLDTWRPFVPAWKERYRLVLVDIIGHGRSDSPEDPAQYTMERVTDDLVRILDHFKIEKTNVLGYSMGGRLALALAVSNPTRVNALILEASSPGLADEKERKARRESDERLAARIERDGIEAFVNEWEKIPLFATQKTLPKCVRERVRAQRLQNSATGLANSLRGMGTGIQPSFWTELEQLHMPVLLLVGEQDTKFCDIAKRMKHKLPAAECYRIPEAGHTVHLEQAVIFDTMVMDYLKKHGAMT